MAAEASEQREFQAHEPSESSSESERINSKKWRGGHGAYKDPEARKAAGLTRETDERNKRLQVAFSIVSITTFILGAAILVFPEKVGYLAFGIGVVQPEGSTQEAINKAADQVKHGEIPSISLNPKSFVGVPSCKLDTVYEVELGIIGAALLGASLAVYLLQRAAGANELNARVYARLNLGLATWAALSLVLSLLGQKYFQRPALLVWTGVLVNVLATAGPLLMQQNPGRVLCEFANESRNVSTNRGAIYLAYAVFFFLEGVFILLFPSDTLKAATNRVPSPVAVLLWQLVAASAHIIVPVAIYNLKSAADTRQLAALSNFIQNSILFVVAFVHVIVLSKAASTGNAGPIGPVLLTAWSSAFIYSLYNMPAAVEAKQD